MRTRTTRHERRVGAMPGAGECTRAVQPPHTLHLHSGGRSVQRGAPQRQYSTGGGMQTAQVAQSHTLDDAAPIFSITSLTSWPCGPRRSVSNRCALTATILSPPKARCTFPWNSMLGNDPRHCWLHALWPTGQLFTAGSAQPRGGHERRCYTQPPARRSARMHGLQRRHQHETQSQARTPRVASRM